MGSAKLKELIRINSFDAGQRWSITNQKIIIMGFAFYHTSKGKGSGSGLGNHIDRVEGKERTYKNADENRKHLNKEFIQKYKDVSLSNAVKMRIEEGYNGKRKIRTDSVKYLTHVLTGSHKEMTEIFKNKQKADEWLKKNYEFSCKEFGKENIVRFNLHLDEKTPHVHVVTVPLTADGRLSAKEVIGNREVLEERQNRYAEQMKAFDLKRGLSAKHTQRKHETAQEYRKRVKNVQNNSFKADLEPIKTLGVVRTGKTIEKLSKQLTSAEKVVNESIASAEQSKNLYDNVFEVANEKRISAEQSLDFSEKERRRLANKSYDINLELTKTTRKLKDAEKVLNKINDKYEIDVQKEIKETLKKGHSKNR